MTTLNEAPPQAKAAKPKAGHSRLEGFLFDFLSGVGVIAVIIWVAGVGLDKGFGVHVPVVPGILVLMAAMVTIKTATTTVASTWHSARVKADAAFMGGVMAFQQAQAEKSSGGLEGLLEAMAKVDSGSAGPYL